VAGVNVTDGGDLTVSLGVSGVARALSPAADQCNVDFLAGRQGFRLLLCLLSGALVYEPGGK
jgi:hypothetical protein